MMHPYGEQVSWPPANEQVQGISVTDATRMLGRKVAGPRVWQDGQNGVGSGPLYEPLFYQNAPGSYDDFGPTGNVQPYQASYAQASRPEPRPHPEVTQAVPASDINDDPYAEVEHEFPEPFLYHSYKEEDEARRGSQAGEASPAPSPSTQVSPERSNQPYEDQSSQLPQADWEGERSAPGLPSRPPGQSPY